MQSTFEVGVTDTNGAKSIAASITKTNQETGAVLGWDTVENAWVLGLGTFVPLTVADTLDTQTVWAGGHDYTLPDGDVDKLRVWFLVDGVVSGFIPLVTHNPPKAMAVSISLAVAAG